MSQNRFTKLIGEKDYSRLVHTVAYDRLTDRINLLQGCNMSRRAVAATGQSTSTPAEATARGLKGLIGCMVWAHVSERLGQECYATVHHAQDSNQDLKLRSAVHYGSLHLVRLVRNKMPQRVLTLFCYFCSWQATRHLLKMTGSQALNLVRQSVDFGVQNALKHTYVRL